MPKKPVSKRKERASKHVHTAQLEKKQKEPEKFSSAIRDILNRVHSGITISPDAMDMMESIVDHVLIAIAKASGEKAQQNLENVISEVEIEAALAQAFGEPALKKVQQLLRTTDLT